MNKIIKTYCTQCPYFTDVIYDGEQWYGAKCKKRWAFNNAINVCN